MNYPRIVLFLPLFVIFVLTGCVGTVPAGKWQVDEEVRQAFVSGVILPEHSYYYLGSVTAPDSIIAIDNHFTLRTKVWAQADFSREMFDAWLNWYRTEKFTACPYYGGVILTPDGKRAGVWYSPNIFNIIQMPEPGVIVVFQPYSYAGKRCGEFNDGT